MIYTSLPSVRRGQWPAPLQRHAHSALPSACSGRQLPPAACRRLVPPQSPPRCCSPVCEHMITVTWQYMRRRCLVQAGLRSGCADLVPRVSYSAWSQVVLFNFRMVGRASPAARTSSHNLKRHSHRVRAAFTYSPDMVWQQQDDRHSSSGQTGCILSLEHCRVSQ